MPSTRLGQFRNACLLAGALAALSACVSTQDQLRTLQQYNAISSSPSTDPAYDWSVVLRNLKPLGVDTANAVDREKLAVAYLGDKCPNGKIVSETALETTTPGLGRGDKDYAVRLKC